ncbi:hypothetical protein CALVIDRAFT_536884 [Calocera viscosa TUFC12733]|uniref:DUF202 domain-containing protein n=1 Tax=Calocera viscosa (strain TUFC12733) TaxID=1330018 RepID=A0A167MQM0_CALVF|nr:hypothetical protein CALVIDRAFT_536884 [Calocera viscosa TUFC12733]
MDQHVNPAPPSAKQNYGATATTSALSIPPPPPQAIAGPSNHSDRANDAEPDVHPGETGFRRRGVKEVLGRFNPQMTLKNTGSVARDHLALERTWLAWTRTSLSIASTGVALVQLFALSAQSSSDANPVSVSIMRVAKPLGAITIAFALVVLIIGSTRYFQVQYALTQQYFPPARVSPVFMSGVMALLVVAVFAVVVSLTK